MATTYYYLLMVGFDMWEAMMDIVVSNDGYGYVNYTKATAQISTRIRLLSQVYQ